MNLKFELKKWSNSFSFWWFKNVHMPLWRIFASKESREEIRKALRQRRESGGCSMWQQQLLKNPELAKYDWEKDFVKQTQTKGA